MNPKEVDLLNLPTYKKESEEYRKLRSDMKRALKYFSTDELIKELRKRKTKKVKFE